MGMRLKTKIKFERLQAVNLGYMPVAVYKREDGKGEVFVRPTTFRELLQAGEAFEPPYTEWWQDLETVNKIPTTWSPVR